MMSEGEFRWLRKSCLQMSSLGTNGRATGPMFSARRSWRDSNVHCWIRRW
jgi:hypothetical protein